MSDPKHRTRMMPPEAPARPARAGRAVILAICGLVLGSPVRAADPPQAAEAPDPDTEKHVVPADPINLLTAMALQLDQQPNFVVLKLQNLPVTQRDVADIIRAMPMGMASLPFKDIYRSALEVAVRQKAMVLHARLDKLDQDPDIIHQGEIAFERILADAWLRRQADAAVTDQALHDRYDRDVAGKPGPEEVRASVILLPTQAEAQAVIDQIGAGADFNDLARQVSKDPTAAGGGDLGYVTRDAVAPEVAAVMFSLAPGEVTTYPVAAPAGYFVIRIEAHSYHKTPTFDEARPALERAIRADAIRATIGTLLANVKYVPPTKPGEAAEEVKPR